MAFFKDFTKSDKLVFKFYVLVVILLIISLLVGCKASKETSHSQQVLKVNQSGLVQLASDNQYHTIKEVVYVPSKSNLNIGNPCDSLGNLKDVNFNTKIGNLEATIKNVNGELSISFSEIDSLRSVIELKERELKKYDSINKLEQETTITEDSSKTTIIVWTKWTWIFLICLILETAYIFRKFIPYLKLLPF